MHERQVSTTTLIDPPCHQKNELNDPPRHHLIDPVCHH